MSFQRLKRYSPWLSQASAAVSLCIVVFMRIKFVFDSGNTAGMLLLIAMLTSLLTLVFGVVALPRWQGFVALGIFGVVAYFILFERMYGVA
jgi:hypothetical protein